MEKIQSSKTNVELIQEIVGGNIWEKYGKIRIYLENDGLDRWVEKKEYVDFKTEIDANTMTSQELLNSVTVVTYTNNERHSTKHNMLDSKKAKETILSDIAMGLGLNHDGSIMSAKDKAYADKQDAYIETLDA